MLDQWMAGYAHGVSGGITTAVRREDYREIQEGNHAFLWNMGNLAGVSTSFILGFKLPMAMAGQIGKAKWATTFATGLVGASEAYGVYEAGTGLTDGVWEYSDVFNLLSLVPYAVPVVAGVGKTLGTLRRNAKVADDVGDALNQANIDRVLDDVGETNVFVGGGVGNSNRGASPTVEAYWNEYYDTVGTQGDDLQSLIDSAKKRGISITSASTSAFDPKTGTIELASNAKKWELFEEFLHKKVAEGWKQDEISELTKKLRKVKNYKGQKSVGAPARSAEEIIVKQWLLRHGNLVGVGEAEKVLLQNQINQLGKYGTKMGY